MNPLEKITEDLKDHSIKDEERFTIIHERLDSIEGKLDKLLQLYDGFGFLGKFVIQVGAVVAALGAIAYTVFSIRHWLNQ